MTAAYRRELAVAISAAREAAAAIAARYGTDPEVRYKTPIEPVTEADVVADRLIREAIHKAFPQDGWLSEESQDDLSRMSCSRVWIVDPLDGTREFIAGRAEFAVSIALVVDGVPVVGAIVNPVTKDCYSAARGQGARANGQRIGVSDASAVSEARVVVSRSETRRGLMTPYEDQMDLQPVGGMAHKLSLVAEGKADATFTTRRRCEWDLAAGLLILEEAGGKVTDRFGEPFTFNQKRPSYQGVMASNGALHDALIRCVDTHEPRDSAG